MILGGFLFGNVQPSAVPPGTLLEKYSKEAAYVDNFQVVVSNAVKPTKRSNWKTATKHSDDNDETTVGLLRVLSGQEQPNDIVRSFAECFFSTWRFFPESCILSCLRWFVRLSPMPSLTNADTTPSTPTPTKTASPTVVVAKYPGPTYGRGFFRVLETTCHEIFMDSGATQSWLSVVQDTENQTVVYRFGSIVKRQSWLLHVLVGPHILYAKYLLHGAVQMHQQTMQMKK